MKHPSRPIPAPSVTALSPSCLPLAAAASWVARKYYGGVGDMFGDCCVDKAKFPSASTERDTRDEVELQIRNFFQ